ncbi:hypothetical protein SIID45300_01452 [Candidatus Magnetaquicoccaceae bacterium FCR-1]|uniref:Helix-turn-helix domain-containing protein n=1 Tax=Candidatus Magnetaquiglobus chichijimensis TaxID=3141448 RepID=A0ABQ0C8C3_9PROT
MTVAGAAEVLRLKPRTLDNWPVRGFGPIYTPTGGRISYDEADLHRWLEQRKVDPTNRNGIRNPKSRRRQKDIEVRDTLNLSKVKRNGRVHAKPED